MSQLNSLGCKVEFYHKRAMIYDGDGEPIGSGDQTRGKLFYLDMTDETCLFVNLMICVYGAKGYVM